MDARTQILTMAPCHAGGRDELVVLAPDHPGFNDPVYRRRRNRIADLALRYRPGTPVPEVEYTDAEHGVWVEVWRNLEPLHRRYAFSAYRRLSPLVGLDHHRIPQLRRINRVLEGLYGFRMLPVAGLVSARMFLSHLAEGIFLSTQYIRHHSMPLYTPEPDICHELIGHAATFGDAELCALNRVFGRAAKHARDAAAMKRVGRLYWYTLEFGVVEERGALKAYGAGLLSSFGELGRFETHASLLPWDVDRIAATPYDPTTYQSTLFVAPSFERMRADCVRWLKAQ